MSAFGERLEGLRWRLTALRRLLRADARPEMTFLERERLPREPMGAIELHVSEVVRGRAFDVLGWAMFPAGPTRRVELFLGGRPLGRARLGMPRLDLARAWDTPHALLTGFEVRLGLGSWDGPDGEAQLTAVATGPGGERYELPAATLTVVPDEEPERKIPPPAERTPLSTATERPRVLVVAHHLGLGGAQLYLLDLLKEIGAAGRASFTVVSFKDGVLRRDLEELGIPVHVSHLVPFDDLSCHIGGVEELVAWAEGRGFEAALVNTATVLTFPGAEAAERLGLPVVWAIHESYAADLLFADVEHGIRERAIAALSGASALVFEADATRRLYEPLAGAGHCHTIPYGLGLGPIEAVRKEFDREAARAEAGIPADAEVIVCVGTLEPRKGQLMLTQAFELVAERHPRARLVLVGAGDDGESQMLAEHIAASPHGGRVQIVGVTPDVQPWYGMADLFVSASDIESLPRTVLEAMAWEVPVLATEVFGLPELIVDGETGWLCEPSDLESLAAGLDRALGTPAEERRRIGRVCRELVESRHSLPRYGERIADLIDGAVAARADNC